MPTTNVSIRMDTDLKHRAEVIFNEMGMNMTTAITIFTKAVVRSGKIPFEISVSQPPNGDIQDQLAGSAADLEADNRLNHQLVSTNGNSVNSKSSSRIKAIIARGREKGRVLNVAEAFTKYPVEEEAHKGKLEYWSQERDTDGL